jgi:hypothetical protein
MMRILVGLLALCVVPALGAQEPEPIGKALELGPLAESFTLVTATRAFDGSNWRFTLKLQAKKDVDTAEVFCQAGFFDKSKYLIYASPLRFSADIPLKTGESIEAYFMFPPFNMEDGVPWRVIAIRPAKRTS